MNGIWGSFSTTDQARMRDALGVQQLPDPNQLTETQLKKLDDLFGYNVSVQILAYEALDGFTDKGEGTAPDPNLPEPRLNDASDLAMALAVLQEKLGTLQIGTAQEGVKISKEKAAKLSEERLGKLKEAIDKLSNASTSNTVGKVFGWIGASLGLVVASIALVAAIAVTIASGGAGAMGIVAATVALGVAVAGMTLMILEETKAMDAITDFVAKNPVMFIALFGPVVGGVLFGLAQSGVLDEQGVKMAFQIAIAAEMLVASIASMVLSLGASSAGGGAALTTVLAKIFGEGSKAAGYVANFAKLAGIASQGISALTTIGGGSAKIAAGAYSYEATTKQAESKEFLAWLQKIQAQLNDEQEQLKKALESLQNDTATAAEILGSIHKSKEAVIGRLGTA